jgi:hypothetical protein
MRGVLHSPSDGRKECANSAQLLRRCLPRFGDNAIGECCQCKLKRKRERPNFRLPGSHGCDRLTCVLPNHNVLLAFSQGDLTALFPTIA